MYFTSLQFWRLQVPWVDFLQPLSSAVFSPGLHTVFPLHVCVPISPYKDPSPFGLGPTPVTSLHFNRLFKDPVFKYSHILMY